MTEINNIETIAVIGAGTMGREIAQVALMAGFNKVILNDIKKEVLEQAVQFIQNGLNKIEAKNKLNEGVSTNLLMKNLFIEMDLEKAVAQADFVIEAIPEIMELKQELFKKLGKYTPKHAILATNTSTMSITKIAESSKKPDKVIGMHFFTPIP
ncbi:MAG: 3-hydroxyacyl-CoA dehydrogenase, partial [Candidatus Lokiarchaeota archaeon]|nr:3-hydroxyacyl-CoA dehydrogenase [Candidatus Lokiarchaeota archaeon]